MYKEVQSYWTMINGTNKGVACSGDRILHCAFPSSSTHRHRSKHERWRVWSDFPRDREPWLSCPPNRKQFHRNDWHMVLLSFYQLGSILQFILKVWLASYNQTRIKSSPSWNSWKFSFYLVTIRCAARNQDMIRWSGLLWIQTISVCLSFF